MSVRNVILILKCYFSFWETGQLEEKRKRMHGWNILNNPAARRLYACCCCCCCWNYPESATKLLLLHNAQQSNYTDSGGYPSLMATACRVQIYTARPAHAVQTGQEGSFEEFAGNLPWKYFWKFHIITWHVWKADKALQVVYCASFRPNLEVNPKREQCSRPALNPQVLQKWSNIYIYWTWILITSLFTYKFAFVS